MSFLDSFLAGATFRSNTPKFDSREELTAFLTGYDDEGAIARIGDTVLRVPDAPEEAVGMQARLRVESFDANEHTGEAALLDVLGEGAV